MIKILKCGDLLLALCFICWQHSSFRLFFGQDIVIKLALYTVIQTKTVIRLVNSVIVCLSSAFAKYNAKLQLSEISI